MSTGSANILSEVSAGNNRVLWFLSPGAAILYPFLLRGFHACITAANTSAGQFKMLAWIAAAVTLTMAVIVPLIALVSATHLFAGEVSSIAELRARRVALLAVAAPPIFTILGVIFYMLGFASMDLWVFPGLWTALIITIAVSDRHTPISYPVQPAKANIRTLHGVIAAIIFLMFLGVHIGNHLAGLLGPEAHTSVMKALRSVYRTSLTEPLLMAAFLMQLLSGGYLLFKLTTKTVDRFRSFQMASGVFLFFFIISHSNAVFVFARGYLGIDPDWAFATGGTAGLIRDSWNIRLVPLYGLAVFFSLSHIAAGARVIMLAKNLKKEVADGVFIWGTALSALASIAILLGMCGLRLHFA